MNRFVLFLAAYGSAIVALASLHNGGIWLDDRGNHINAHGGCVLFHEGVYYWYGEHKIAGEDGNVAHGTAVGVYSSCDLLHWKNDGAALTCSSDPYSDITDGCIIERPKVLFCVKTGKFVMHFHLELKRGDGPDYHFARTGVAVADRPTGPFRYLCGLRPNAGVWPQDADPKQCNEKEAEAARHREHANVIAPNLIRDVNLLAEGYDAGQMTRDQTLFLDDDGTAYQISASEENSTLQIAELTEDFLGFTGRYWRMAEKEWTEAPAVCKRGGWYFLLGSGCTGWKPNAARLYRAKKITGPWERLGNPCVGVNPENGLGSEKTWGGQSAFILKFPGQGRFVALFDIWNPKNAIDGRYIWLPIDFSGDELRIIWRDVFDPMP